MARYGCLNGEPLDESSYSAPMPLIGVYIVVATLVCFLFMFRDIWVGWRDKKRWLPCHRFSLNSLTLTLLSIVAKLPVDLTTSMPSPQDQLSKLTATTLICVCMAFFLPSIGTMGRSECFSNMYALTIFVITVIVNIGIQLRTGVIFSFRKEHLLVLSLMFLLLVLFWCCTLEVHNQKNIDMDNIRKLLLQGKEMMHRLKMGYVYSYTSDPQLVICINPYIATVGLVSIVCTVVLSEAVVRSFFAKDVRFCGGHSDYKWSMLIVVVTQIATVILGFVGNFFRWASLVPHMNNRPLSHIPYSQYKDDSTSESAVEVILSLVLFLKTFINNVMTFVSMLLVVYGLALTTCFLCDRKPRYYKETRVFLKEYKARNIKVDKWILDKGIGNLRRCGALKRVRPNYLEELFSNFKPSQEPFSCSIDRIRTTIGTDSIPKDYRLTPLSLIILFLRAAAVLPEKAFMLLYNSLVETFEIVCFINKKTNVFDFDHRGKLVSARSIWKVVTDCGVIGFPTLHRLQYISHPETRIVDLFITYRVHSQVPEEKYHQMQQLFVDMLNWFLVKVPKALLKHVLEGSPEDYKERIEFSMETIYRLESIEHKVQWKIPRMTDINYLISSTVSENIQDSPTQLNAGHAVVETEDTMHLQEQTPCNPNGSMTQVEGTQSREDDVSCEIDENIV